MPVDRSMSVSLTDQSQRLLLTFRRADGKVVLDTWIDGIARESQVSLTDLQQLSVFLTDLVGARWSDPPVTDAPRATTPDSRPQSRPSAAPPAGDHTSYLPPYPVGARWVPPPSGGSSSTAPRTESTAQSG